jgi:hypothetical protein
VRRDQSGLRVVLLEVNVRNALHLLGLLLTFHLHLVGWDMKSVLLVVELYVGVVEVELEIMELIP